MFLDLLGLPLSRDNADVVELAVLFGSNWSLGSRSPVLPAGIGHIPRIEVVFLLDDLAVAIDREAVGDAQHGGRRDGNDFDDSLGAHRGQRLVAVIVEDLDTTDSRHERGPPDGAELLPADERLVHAPHVA